MADREYTALAYDTITGRVIYEIDLAADPSWDARINDSGNWSISVPLGDRAPLVQIREWCNLWRFSAAIVLNDVVCQAGPVTGYAPDKDNPLLTVTGQGLWALLNRRLQHDKGWNPAAVPITDPSADTTFTDSLPNIALDIVTNATTWTYRLGSALPVDLPAAIAGGGTNVRTYHGYEKAYAGQRLQELTQVDGGPDVIFAPYQTVISGVRYIRHKMLIGNPLLTQPGVPLLFDYRSSLASLDIVGDGTALATSAFVPGAGNDAAALFGYATSPTLLGNGWPALDMVDGAHTDATQQATVDGWATADIALYGTQPEQWKASVLADADPRWGSYLPGHYAGYSVQDHHWLPNGIYQYRILGVSHSGSSQRGIVDHQLQAVRAN